MVTRQIGRPLTDTFTASRLDAWKVTCERAMSTARSRVISPARGRAQASANKTTHNTHPTTRKKKCIKKEAGRSHAPGFSDLQTNAYC
jgi:hypothetical protein